jgi:hypothetical protein
MQRWLELRASRGDPQPVLAYLKSEGARFAIEICEALAEDGSGLDTLRSELEYLSQTVQALLVKSARHPAATWTDPE